MKNSVFIRYIIIILATISIAVGIMANVTVAADPQRVALLPFKINAEKDLTFLQNGIFDMLSSRLSDPGKVQILSRAEIDTALAGAVGPQDEAAARNLGQTLAADHVLFGSLTMLGESLSIDAKMIDVSGAKPPVAVFTQSPDIGGIIPSIDQFAADINARVFDRGTPGKSVAAAPAPAAPPPSAKDASQAHPETLYRKGETQVSPFVTRNDLLLRSPNMWKGPNFKYLINGMAVGDVDGDGRSEIVVVSPDQIYVYRFQSERLMEIARQDTGSDNYNIGVDVADLNGNGRAEIFVTALNNFKTAVRSYVREFDGKAFVELEKGLAWYFRASDLPVRGRVLLGQQARMYDPYRGAIFEMGWDGGAYVPQNPVSTPGRTRINVLGATLGDVQNNGEETLVAVDQGNRIVIVSPGGESLWKSGDKYGGSTLFLEGPKTDQGQVQNPVWLPMRILVRNATPGEEGAKSQVVAVRNHDFAGMRLDRRDFTDASIEAFSWDGVGLAPVWSTRKVSGFIRDIQVADFDDDGREELLIALVAKSGSVMLTSPKSALIAYELDAAPASPDTSTGQ